MQLFFFRRTQKMVLAAQSISADSDDDAKNLAVAWASDRIASNYGHDMILQVMTSDALVLQREYAGYKV